MNDKAAKILLASVILVRSSSFMLNKYSLSDMDVFNLMAVRFLMAFLILLIIFAKKIINARKKDIWYGTIIGTVFFTVMSFEVASLTFCQSSTVAFIENTAIVLVPLFEIIIFRNMPVSKPRTAAGLLLSVAGVALLTLKDSVGDFNIGYILALMSSFTYAGAIIVTDRLSKKGDPVTQGIIQIGVMGILSLMFSCILEAPHLPSTPESLWAVVFLALVCSCFGFTFQPVAQKYTSSQTAALYCALGPLGAGVLGFLFLDEKLGISGLIGALLILAAMVISREK